MPSTSTQGHLLAFLSHTMGCSGVSLVDAGQARIERGGGLLLSWQPGGRMERQKQGQPCGWAASHAVLGAGVCGARRKGG